MNEQEQKLFEKLSSSKKYADICADTLLRVFTECLARHKKAKDAEKAARERLHAITGAFMQPEELSRARKALPLFAEKDKSALHDILSQHASTRERLPFENMEALYSTIFEYCGTPATVLDLACGLNPIYLGYKGLDVTGIDIQNGAVELINSAGKLAGLPMRAICADLLSPNAIPSGHYSICLVFKLLPVLETQKSGAAKELLRSIKADRIVVTFPTRTLTGRNIGMEEHYTTWMEQNTPTVLQTQHRFICGSELIYILAPAT